MAEEAKMRDEQLKAMQDKVTPTSIIHTYQHIINIHRGGRQRQ
jgi:hypothetical protein